MRFHQIHFLTITNMTMSGSARFVRVSCDDLYIRKGAGTKYKAKGFIKPGVYTIVETKDEWGRLKSGAGWICLDYVNRI